MKQLYYIISFLITFNVLYMCQIFDVIGTLEKILGLNMAYSTWSLVVSAS